MQEYLAARHVWAQIDRGEGLPDWITKEGWGSDHIIGVLDGLRGVDLAKSVVAGGARAAAARLLSRHGLGAVRIRSSLRRRSLGSCSN